MPPLQVVAAAIIDSGKVLLVSKQEAPDVFYLPGGKPERDEQPRDTLARELEEELGVAIIDADLFGVVSDEAALEGVAMEMHVYLATVDGEVAPRAEIAALAWVDATGASPGTLAPLFGLALLCYLTVHRARLVTIAGAIAMLRARRHGLAMLGSIVAMLNVANVVNCCCFASILVGGWSLMVLLEPNVRAEFHRVKTTPPPA